MTDEESKAKARIKRRNNIAKNMLVDQRSLYSERTVKDKTKRKERISSKVLAKNYKGEDSDVE